MNSKLMLAAATMLLATLGTMVAKSTAGGGRAFYLAETDAGARVQSIDIAEGETKVLAGAPVISIIIPFTPGSKSGDLSGRDDRNRSVAIRCRNGRIEPMVIGPDGSVLRELPAFELAEARQVDMRINITTADGSRSAYRISRWDSVTADHGPVLDMFAGKIPLKPGGYSITTETLAAEELPDLSGAVPLVPIDHWLTADALLVDGRTVRLLLDLGATTSVIAAGALPEGTVVTPYRMVEYSDEGRQESDVVIPGAGGMTSNICGTASLAGVQIGDLVLEDLPAVVLEKFPEAISRKGLHGILGIDQLRRAGRLAIVPGMPGGRRLLLGDRIGERPAPDHTVPFTEADNKLFVSGTVNGTPVDFILDSGAARSVIEPATAAAAPTPLRDAGLRSDAVGLDGTPIENREMVADRLVVGGCRLEEFPVMVSDLHVLSTIGLSGSAGLLGADFLSRFERVEIDFGARTMSLWELPDEAQSP